MSKPLRLALFFDLPQDVAVLLPLLVRAMRDQRFDVSIYHTTRLQKRWQDNFAQLAAHFPNSRCINHRLLKFGLVGRLPCDALLTASESSESGHYAAYNLTRSARHRGIRTYTMQHGFENIGLTYQQAGAPISFASDHVLLWNRPEALPAWVSAATRVKCYGVGRTAPDIAAHIKLPETLPSRRILVCHNLHWERYDDAYRAAFFQQLAAAVQTHGDIGFILRGHPGVRRQQNIPPALLALPNFIVLDSAFPIGNLLGAVECVITTPSTTAVDAAQAGIPVALFKGNLDLPLYDPLHQLQKADDWTAYLVAEPAELQALNAQFLARHILPGDAALRALDLIALAK